MKTVVINSVFYLMAVLTLNAQVSINPTGLSPDPSAALDVSWSNRGLLIPRVALTQTTSPLPITSPATSLLVYNTATQNDVTPGYYYWDGTKWIRFGNANLNCNTQNMVLKSDGINAVCSQIYDNGTSVGIGTTSPDAQLKLEVVGHIQATTGSIRSVNENTWANHDIFIAANDKHPAFVGLRSRNTLNSPSYPLSGDVLLELTGRDIIDGYTGFGGNIYAFGGAAILFRAAENFSGTNKGSYISFFTTPLGSNLQQERMRLTSEGNLILSNGNMDGPRLTWKGGIGANQTYNARVHNNGSLSFFPVEMGNPGYVGEVLILTQDGKVGINTTAPLAPFHVYTGVNNAVVAGLQAAGVGLGITIGTNVANTTNNDGVVYFDVPGTETYVFGGHVIPDGNQTRDLGQNPNHLWRYVYAQDVYIPSLGWLSGWSDERLKKDIKPMESTLDKLLKLKPVEFYWKKDAYPEKKFNDKKQLGLIAQEVEKIYPELVNTNEDGYKTIDYAKFTSVLIKAIQELNERITKLENENRELKEFNKNLINSFGNKN